MLHINPFFHFICRSGDFGLLIFPIKVMKFIVRCYRRQSYHFLNGAGVWQCKDDGRLCYFLVL
ncbi:hypothetical protein NEILACOT_03669 [Neisseria lactamica ATCC 23970]|nr:hypothetical protein NEILACOT_03669 [Neisseria lactamica ATCC 23970]